MPVLAIGGAASRGDAVAADARTIARDVTPLTIDGCGHYVPEEAPDELLGALGNFLHDVGVLSNFLHDVSVLIDFLHDDRRRLQGLTDAPGWGERNMSGI